MDSLKTVNLCNNNVQVTTTDGYRCLVSQAARKFELQFVDFVGKKEKRVSYTAVVNLGKKALRNAKKLAPGEFLVKKKFIVKVAFVV